MRPRYRTGRASTIGNSAKVSRFPTIVRLAKQQLPHAIGAQMVDRSGDTLRLGAARRTPIPISLLTNDDVRRQLARSTAHSAHLARAKFAGRGCARRRTPYRSPTSPSLRERDRLRDRGALLPGPTGRQRKDPASLATRRPRPSKPVTHETAKSSHADPLEKVYHAKPTRWKMRQFPRVRKSG